MQGHTLLGGAWEPLAPGVFLRSSVTGQFAGDPQGEKTELRVTAGRVKNIRFHKQR